MLLLITDGKVMAWHRSLNLQLMGLGEAQECVTWAPSVAATDLPSPTQPLSCTFPLSKSCLLGVAQP